MTTTKKAPKKKSTNSSDWGATKGNLWQVDPNNVVVIGIDTNDDNGHPLYDERIKLPLDRHLIDNLKEEGNHTPILVRRNGSTYEVVDGKQRVRNARQANIELKKAGREEIRIKAVVEQGDDAEMFGVLILANELRRGDTPMCRARKISKYISLGRTKKDAALRFGVTGRTIDLWLRLMDLDDKVQDAVDSGKISASNAGELADLSREEQVAKLEELLADGGRVNHEDVVKAKTSGSGELKKSRKPKKAVLKALLDYAKGKEDDGKKSGIPDDAYAALLWVDGKVGASDVPWLMKILRKLSEEDGGEGLMDLAGTGPVDDDNAEAGASA